jgi:serine/threonine protein kinase
VKLADPSDIFYLHVVSFSIRPQLAHVSGYTVPNDSARGEVSIKKIGSWLISGKVGAGGQATVLKGERQLLDGTKEQAAIKLVPVAKAHENAVKLLAHESTLLRRLDNPHIARVLDDGWEDLGGTTYAWMATELIKGDDLEAEIRQFGPLAKDKWLELAFDVFSGLSAAHQEGIIHCDLKPGNILRNSRRSVLIDFGMASFVRVVDAGDYSGSTPGFEAPEQLDGSFDNQDLEYPVDLFSAGITLVYAATGWLPWDLTNEYRHALEGMRKNASAQTAATYYAARENYRKLVTTTQPRLEGLDAEQISVVTQLLNPKPQMRGSAAETLLKLKQMLPEGSSRKQDTTQYAARRSLSPGEMSAPSSRSSSASVVAGPPAKSYSTALTLATWLGFVGADRWYLGQYWTAFFKYATFGGFGVWWFIDALSLANGERLDGKGRGLVGNPTDLPAARAKTRKQLIRYVPIVIVAFILIGIFAPKDEAALNSNLTNMPDVTNYNLSDVEDLLGGLTIDSIDVSGEGRSVFASSNWKVCDQSIQPGTRISDENLLLEVVKVGEDCPAG